MLEGLTPPSAKRSCKVASVAATLSDKDKDILFKAISDPDNWPIKSLSRALGERGIQLSDTPLTSHRAKACVCFG
jgi:hypothetical protein